MFSPPYSSANNDKYFAKVYEYISSLESLTSDWSLNRNNCVPINQKYVSEHSSQLFITSRIEFILRSYIHRESMVDSISCTIKEVEIDIIKTVYQIYVHIRHCPYESIRCLFEHGEKLLKYTNKIIYPYITSIDYAMVINLNRLFNNL